MCMRLMLDSYFAVDVIGFNTGRSCSLVVKQYHFSWVKGVVSAQCRQSTIRA